MDIEQIASAVHDAWWKEKKSKGFIRLMNANLALSFTEECLQRYVISAIATCTLIVTYLKT